MVTAQLKQLAKTYRRRGIVTPSDLLLEPKDALELLDELAKLHVLVTGANDWTYVNKEVNKERRQAYEIPGGGFSVEEYIPYLDMTPEASIELVKQYIKERFPPTCDLVSIDFDDPRISDLFTEEENTEAGNSDGLPWPSSAGSGD